MAYLTFPWCLTPQLIADEAAEYRCYTCAADRYAPGHPFRPTAGPG